MASLNWRQTLEATSISQTSTQKNMKRTLKIILGVIAVLVGLALAMPAVAQWRHEGAMTASSVALCLLGAVLTVTGFGTAFLGGAKRGTLASL